jgi:hypothetical protein
MNPPGTEAIYVTGIHEILWGGVLVAITLAMHGFGMLLTLRFSGAFKERFDRSHSFALGLTAIILASWMIILVHLIEVFVWAGFFLATNAVNTQTSVSANASLCYYFALCDYTCLGSNYNLTQRWRLLEGMIAMAGLLTFAWSTGVLLTLAQEFQDQQLLLLKQRREKRGHPIHTVPGDRKPS